MKVKAMSSKLSLDSVEWRAFEFREIFKEIKRGKRLTKKDQLEGDIPYISSTALNNGVDGFIGNDSNVRKFKYCLTVANSGSVGACFYHHYEFIASDHVTSLELDKGCKEVYLFLSVIIKRLEEKYSFNREINDTRIEKEKLMLPVDEEGNPNWTFMVNYIRQEQKTQIEKLINYYEKKLLEYTEIDELPNVDWKEFWLEDIVEIKSGVRLTKANQIPGNRPFIGSTSQNNGITGFVANINNSLDSNVLGVNYNGSVVDNFYHPYECIFSDDVKRLHFKEKSARNKYCYFFLKQVILQQKSKYAYGYKFNAARMKRQKIMLPVDENSKPHWDYMRKYMQKLEAEKISKILEYLRRNVAV